jgi:hypothetical protein
VAFAATLAAILALGASAFEGEPAPAPAPAPIEIRVDPRVELLSIVFRLAGNPEYSMASSVSPYAKTVEAKFGAHRAHPAVLMARELRASRGVSYDAVASFAVHLTEWPEIGEATPFEPLPTRLDERWTPALAREFLGKLRTFVADTGFTEFVAEQSGFYARASQRLEETLASRARLEWFDSFFGARPGARYVVSVGLLNGGANYGVGVIHAGGREEITPIIGVWRFDADGLPIYGDEVLPTVAHELCHSYTNPIVDANLAALEPIGRRLFEIDPEPMKRQAYGNGKTVMYETLVRACVVRWRHGLDGAEGVKKEIEEQAARGFEWVGDVAAMLESYENDRKTYSTFESFVPRLVQRFAEWEREAAERAERAPKVVEIVPRSGAIDVDPSVTELRVTFDRPMRDKSWSLCGRPEFMPVAAGEPSFDAERRTFILPIRLEPGRAYRFSLNDVRSKGFRGEDGLPLQPVPVTFTTRE